MVQFYTYILFEIIFRIGYCKILNIALLYSRSLLFILCSIADGDCSHEIKRRLLLGRKVMTNLDSILKSRDTTLPTKVHGQGYGFSSSHVWM